jgi:hypothetical protein
MIEEIKTQEPKELLCPKAGTATSSPVHTEASQSINIVNIKLWTKKNAYEDSTNKKLAQPARQEGNSMNFHEKSA